MNNRLYQFTGILLFLISALVGISIIISETFKLSVIKMIAVSISFLSSSFLWINSNFLYISYLILFFLGVYYFTRGKTKIKTNKMVYNSAKIYFISAILFFVSIILAIVCIFRTGYGGLETALFCTYWGMFPMLIVWLLWGGGLIILTVGIIRLPKNKKSN